MKAAMKLVDKINEDIKTAMKKGDKTRLSVLRMFKSDLKYRQIDAGRDITDDDCVAVLSSAAKKRRDAIEGFGRGGRNDLVDKEKAELEIINEYLPKQISDEELSRLVDDVVSETNASTTTDIGMVMKNIMPRVKGRVDGRKVNELVVNKLKE